MLACAWISGVDECPALAAPKEEQNYRRYEQGNGTIDGQRLYQLIRQKAPIDDRTFEIEFLEPGVDVFAFTFG